METISQYLEAIQNVTVTSSVTYLEQAVDLNEGLSIGIDIIQSRCASPSTGRVCFVGNGGSAAIASHLAIDFWKNGGIPAFSFNDASLLTCISNDYSYAQVYEKPINMFLSSMDVLVAISSSGKSENILNAVKAAKEKNVFVITLSGFSDTNPLRGLGDLNFYVDNTLYGVVENSHQILLHYINDHFMGDVQARSSQVLYQHE